MAATPQERRKLIEKGRREVDEGLPGWFNTFADMMTLLFAFFVLLAAISTIDPVKLQEMSDAINKSVGKTQKKQGAMSLSEIEKAMKVMIQKEKLQDVMEVRTSPKGVTINLSSDISFESGSSDLKPQIIPVLQKIVPTMNNTYYAVAVEGHTDSDPIPEKFQVRYPTNWELSSARAASVVRILVNMGVDPTRLQSVGYAEFVPRDRPGDQLIDQNMIYRLNQTEDLKARNRRVEITFLSIRG